MTDSEKLKELGVLLIQLSTRETYDLNILWKVGSHLIDMYYRKFLGRKVWAISKSI